MIDPRQFRDHVIRPTLVTLAKLAGLPQLASPAAEVLLLGTALQESQLTYLVQLGDGSGFGGHGVYQDEPGDLHDMLNNFVAFRPVLAAAINQFRSKGPVGDDVARLEVDLAWATVICRLHYFRSTRPMPAADDLAGLCAFYKQDYNTPLGAATPAQVKANFQRALAIA